MTDTASQSAAKKYCLDCFQVFSGEQDSCPHCGYIQPKSFNQTYLKPPYRLKGQYVIGRVLGHGGFAITYLGYDRNLGTKVAIKEYFPAEFAMRAPDGENVMPYSGDKQTLFQLGKEKFIAEARLLATLRNPNIIRIRQFLETCNTAYFVMEYLEGSTLMEYVRDHGGQLSWAETKKLLLPMLDALEEVHVKQCFHRDIKPDNVYITERGQPILIDFGAARQQMTGATTNLLAFLTPGFAPAEQYSANGIQGPWTDIYSLAATMYFCITGQTPPVPQDRALGDSELVPPSKQGIEISPEDEDWLLNGLEVKWSHRPESVQHWRRMLERQRNTSQTIELSGDELKREMEMAFLRSAILPRLMSRFLTPTAEREIHEAAGFVGLSREQVDALIEQALLMTGSERRVPTSSSPAPEKPKSAPARPSVARPNIGAWVKKTQDEQTMATEPEKSKTPDLTRETPGPKPKIEHLALDPKDISSLPPRFRNSLGMEFILIKPFEFIADRLIPRPFNMGTSVKPYKVTLTRPYYLQSTQITQGQWRTVMGQNPSHFEGDDWQPVEMVSWDDIAPFLQRINMLNEGFYRLPSEAEWEYASRGGSHGVFCFGNEEKLLTQFAWFDVNSNERPHAVGMKKPNKWGLYDMHGNVWEWVADRFGPYPGGELIDPKGPDRGDTRVMRGGAFNLGANYCKVVSRNYEAPSYRANNLGLRLLLETR